MPSRAFAARQAVTRTTVSPERTMTEPWACLASLPVSRVMVRDPIRISRRWRFTLCIGVAERYLRMPKRLISSA